MNAVINTVFVSGILAGRNCKSVILGDISRDTVVVDGEVFHLEGTWRIDIGGSIESLTLLDDCHKLVVEGGIKHLSSSAEVCEDDEHMISGQRTLRFPNNPPKTEGASISVHGDIGHLCMHGRCSNTRITGFINTNTILH